MLKENLEYKGYKISIELDDNAESPRSWDNMGKMVVFHKRYNLPNELGLNHEEFNSWEDMGKHLKLEFKAVVILPVYMFDHSNVSFSTGDFNDRWDSGQVGYIIATKKAIKDTLNVKYITREVLKRARDILTGEIETYSQYASGEVYGYVIEKPVTCEHCNHIENEVIGSCWGFYGYDEALNGAKEEIDNI